MRLSLALTCALLACAISTAHAETTAQPQHRALSYKTGTVTFGEQLATAALPDGWRYLESTDAHYVIEQLWGNPPGGDYFGLIVPPGAEPDAEDGWAIVVSYSKDGHVKDDDAAKLDYADMLKEMQQATLAENDARKQAGYEAMELVGWAEAPHYDAAAHKLYFAENLRRIGAQRMSLNYKVRILGRDGYLVMNAVAASTQLSQVAAGSKIVLGATEFTAGHRYDEFKPGYDKVAAYGIGGLIATGLLAKVGFFGLIGKFLIAFIKPILVGGAVVGGAVAKLFTRKKDPRDEAPAPRT